MAGSPPHRGATSHAPASSTRATSDSGPRCLKLLKNKPEINSDLLNSFAAAPPIRAFRTLRPRRPPPPRPSPAPVARDSGKSGVKADRNPRQLQIEDIGIQDKLCWQSFDILHAFGRTPVVPSGAVSVRSGTGIGFRPRKVDGGGHVADCSCRILFARRCSTGSRTLCIVPDPAALPFFRKEHRAGRFVLRVPLSLPARPGAPLPHRHGVPALPGNSTIRWQWIGASGQSPWEPRDSSGDTVSYFLSPDPRQWIRSLPTSRRILRRSLYPRRGLGRLCVRRRPRIRSDPAAFRRSGLHPPPHLRPESLAHFRRQPGRVHRVRQHHPESARQLPGCPRQKENSGEPFRRPGRR